MRDANDNTMCESSGVTDFTGLIRTLARSERKKCAYLKLGSDSNTVVCAKCLDER